MTSEDSGLIQIDQFLDLGCYAYYTRYLVNKSTPGCTEIARRFGTRSYYKYLDKSRHRHRHRRHRRCRHRHRHRRCCCLHCRRRHRYSLRGSNCLLHRRLAEETRLGGRGQGCELRFVTVVVVTVGANGRGGLVKV